jgi:alpha-amylase
MNNATPHHNTHTTNQQNSDLYVLDSAYGSERELRSALAALKRRGLKPVADIVINHRCASHQEHGKWNRFGGRLAWDASAICSNNPAWGGRGGRKTGDDYPAAPNIDHTQVLLGSVVMYCVCC